MAKTIKKISWISYCALLLSVIPVLFFFALLYSINWEGIITMPLIITIMIMAFILSLIGFFKKTENKVVPSVALLITLGSGFFIGLIVIVSGMGQPT
ncbi:hypothetical protein [Lentibacillus jeotgali]|uniref:hypothetical protein n=1 Tax=Lentibacillus jeotgali TaxID=558169 RepID=UPI0002626FA4|nr:hypothetical protein [Lentibacillus jeotgali]